MRGGVFSHFSETFEPSCSEGPKSVALWPEAGLPVRLIAEALTIAMSIHCRWGLLVQK